MGKYILYVKTSCPYCVQAEDLLASRGERAMVIPFDNDLETLDHMKWAYDHETVPMIFHVVDSDIKFIGGYTELVVYLDGTR